MQLSSSSQPRDPSYRSLANIIILSSFEALLQRIHQEIGGADVSWSRGRDVVEITYAWDFPPWSSLGRSSASQRAPESITPSFPRTRMDVDRWGRKLGCQVENRAVSLIISPRAPLCFASYIPRAFSWPSHAFPSWVESNITTAFARCCGIL